MPNYQKIKTQELDWALSNNKPTLAKAIRACLTDFNGQLTLDL